METFMKTTTDKTVSMALEEVVARVSDYSYFNVYKEDYIKMNNVTMYDNFCSMLDYFQTNDPQDFIFRENLATIFCLYTEERAMYKKLGLTLRGSSDAKEMQKMRSKLTTKDLEKLTIISNELIEPINKLMIYLSNKKHLLPSFMGMSRY